MSLRPEVSRELTAPRMDPRGAALAPRGLRLPAAAPLILVSGAAVGAYSVPRYDWRIVAAYVVLLALLAASAIAGALALRHPRDAGPAMSPGPLTRAPGAAALAAAGILVWAFPGFTYVTGPGAVRIRAVISVGALVSAAVTALPWRHAADLALTVAGATYAASSAAALRLDPAPRIDVWYTLQGAADGILHGSDMYQQVWAGPMGQIPYFTYLPWTAVLLAPGRWLLGDVRWALAGLTLLTVVMVRLLPARMDHGTSPATTGAGPRRAAALAGAMLLLLPGTQTQVEQAWTEPLLLACLTLMVLALSRGRGLLAVVAFALACASKQHMLLLLPVLAAWPRFGPRRAAGSALLAGLLVLPWVVADPQAIWHDTVTLLVNFPPLKFADTVYIAMMNEWGVQPPFWITGAVVAGAITLAAVSARRLDPPPAQLLRWCALVLFAASLVNKQAFYNQYWLVAGLVLLSWAAPDAPGSSGVPDAPDGAAPSTVPRA